MVAGGRRGQCAFDLGGGSGSADGRHREWAVHRIEGDGAAVPATKLRRCELFRDSRQSGAAVTLKRSAGDGEAGVAALAKDAHTMDFIKDQYRHGKPILVLGASSALLDKSGVPGKLPDGKPDPGLIIAAQGSQAAAVHAFIKGVCLHQQSCRAPHPPPG